MLKQSKQSLQIKKQSIFEENPSNIEVTKLTIDGNQNILCNYFTKETQKNARYNFIKIENYLY